MRILVSTLWPELWRQQLRTREVDFVGCSEAELSEALARGHYGAVYLNEPVALAAPPGLQLIQLSSAGYEQILAHRWLREVPHITTAAGTCAHYLAEHIALNVLVWAKQFRLHLAHQADRRWPDRTTFPHRTPRGQCAVIIGYGAAGREAARLLHALGMRIVAVTRTGQRSPFGGWLPPGVEGDARAEIPDTLLPMAELGLGLAQADYIIPCLPLSKETQNLFNRDRLQRARPGAVLINISRGRLVDDEALAEALNKRQLAHAFLDVFDEEPLPSDSPWWNHPHVTVTPHIAGIMPPDEVVQTHAALFQQNLERLAAGSEPLNKIRPV